MAKKIISLVLTCLFLFGASFTFALASNAFGGGDYHRNYDRGCDCRVDYSNYNCNCYNYGGCGRYDNYGNCVYYNNYRPGYYDYDYRYSNYNYGYNYNPNYYNYSYNYNPSYGYGGYGSAGVTSYAIAYPGQNYCYYGDCNYYGGYYYNYSDYCGAYGNCGYNYDGRYDYDCGWRAPSGPVITDVSVTLAPNYRGRCDDGYYWDDYRGRCVWNY